MKFRNVIKTFLIMVVFCALWQWLEMLFYGAIEQRAVDDIIFLFMIPFFYYTVSHFDNRKEQKQKTVVCPDEIFEDTERFQPLSSADKIKRHERN